MDICLCSDGYTILVSIGALLGCFSCPLHLGTFNGDHVSVVSTDEKFLHGAIGFVSFLYKLEGNFIAIGVTAFMRP